MQRTLAALLLISGLGIGGFTLLDTTGDDVGSVTVDDPAQAAAAPTPDATTAPADAPTTPSPTEPAPTQTAPDIARSSARISDVDLSSPPAPASLTVGGIDVTAPVVPVGIDPDGLMTVPDNVRTVGWYRFSSAPTEADGTIVIAGHVDDRVQGRGAFFDLRAVDVGETVTLTDDDGTETTWRITGRRSYEKESLPIEDLYRRTGDVRLVLITCGGDFDRAARSYESNVVVEAEPVS